MTLLLLTILITLIITIPISILWANGIDHMQKNYPDYKGEDLFNEDL
jgi:hypothetical protein